MPQTETNKIKNQGNLNKIEELYTELETCFSSNSCDHVKATSILNTIVERKKLLHSTPEISRYVDLKRLIYHYVKSADQKELHYDEINVSQIEKKIQEFTPEQALNLYEVFRRELNSEGYPKKVQELSRGIDLTKLKVYQSERGLKSWLKWLSIRCSYKTRYLFFMIIGSFVVLNIILLPSQSVSLFRFSTIYISDVPFFNHLGNLLVFILGLSENVKIEPLNFFGVLIMFIGKGIFVLFIVNFLLKKILDKILG